MCVFCKIINVVFNDVENMYIEFNRCWLIIINMFYYGDLFESGLMFDEESMW